MTEKQYRMLLTVYAALIVVLLAAMFVSPPSDALMVALGNEPKTWPMSNFWVAGGIAGVLMLMTLIGLVGLFLFKAWARPLSVFATAFALLLQPFIGASVFSGIEFALIGIESTLWGVILALSYSSPIGDRFGR
ncbi:hypothetical protein [Hydrogenophaga sp. RWCD_12]|uniref:hypothetical protein n=1 Tax=Hydrogenophaga sp. RWCD_12 TaxID=3391190 RepID=UPI00398502BA